MAVTLNLKVEDDAVQILTYTQIEVYRATSPTAAFGLLGTVALVSGQFYYTYTDNTGTLNHWYRFRFHNPTGPVDSDYSDIFQVEGATRLKIRQQMLQNFKIGLVAYAAASGQTTTNIRMTDYRLFNSLFATGRAKGAWGQVTTGANAGMTFRVVDSAPALGDIIISPALAIACTVGDELEISWLAGAEEQNLAINAGLKRYMYLDRVPIKGLGTPEIPLTFLPWLKSKRQVCSLWYYPLVSTSGVNQGVEVGWGSSGRWWAVRQEGGNLTLMTSPTLAATDTVYMECLRPMSELWTDVDVAPKDCNLDLAAALAYDEVLAGLTRPNQGGAAIDRAAWLAERISHQRKIVALAKQFGPHPRYQPPQLPGPSVIPVVYSAR